MSSLKLVKIMNGSYMNQPVHDVTLPFIKAPKAGKKGLFITVDTRSIFGHDRPESRVHINSEDSVEYLDGTVDDVSVAQIPAERAAMSAVPRAMAAVKRDETPEQAMDRIRERFDIIDTMTHAVAKGVVRGLIVSGPPGVGKSFGVEKILEEYEAINKLSGETTTNTEIVKGAMTPIGLYQTLYDNSSNGSILVFDDCDSVLFDEVCLNMLKAVLDSGKKRIISWKSESNALRRDKIPDRFEFKGGCVFITNVSFAHVRSKKIADHLQALMSRCHYIDLELDSVEDRFLRIKQIVGDGMLDEYNFGPEGDAEVIDFMLEKASLLREISLRQVLKIADLRKMAPGSWRNMAEATCMRRNSEQTYY